MTNNLIPQEAEAAVVGIILIDPNAVITAAQHIGPGDFGTPVYRRIAEAAWYWLGQRTPPTSALILERLRATAQWSDFATPHTVCGQDFQALLMSVPNSDASFVAHHAREVARYSVRRKGIDASARVGRMFADMAMDDAELQSEQAKMMGDVFTGAETRPADIGGILDAHEEKIQAQARGEAVPEAIRTRLAWLDSATGGIYRGQVWVITGPYKGRKTTFAHNMVLAAAMSGHPVSVFTNGDSTRRDTSLRFVAMVMNLIAIEERWPEYNPVSAATLRNHLRNEQYNALRARAVAIVKALPLRLYDAGDGIGDLKITERLILRDKAMHGTEVSMYDYAQTIKEGRGDYEKTVLFASWAQNVIGDDMALLALSQQNEQAVMGAYKDSYSPGTKGGGALPAAANVLITLEHTAPYLKATLKLARDAESLPDPVSHTLVPASGLILESKPQIARYLS